MKKGFTLIEMVITLSIMAMIATAVFSTLAGGINVYKRVKDYGGQQRDALLSLEKFGKELSNIFVISGINFTGDSKNAAFPGFVSVSSGNPSGIGRVSYYFDDKTGDFLRVEQGYAETMVKSEKPQPIAPRKIASLKSLTFSYYYFDQDAKIYVWKNSWDTVGTIPIGVKIETEFDTGAKTIKVNRIVFIPIAG